MGKGVGDRFHFRDLELEAWPGVYEPAEDSLMIAENISVCAGEVVLDIGTGCGLLAILAARMGGRVVATDVNPLAIACARENARTQGVLDRVDLRLGDLFEPVGDERFDLVLFNPPYLPVSPDERTGDLLELAWDGGKTGRSVLDRFLKELPDHMNPGGRALFVQSSLTGEHDTAEAIEKSGLRWRVISRKKFSFEELMLFRCESPNVL
ncbi:MAG: class I SAM-dependent methyltransferase [Candidatus Hadarchaeales archaeon]